MFMLVALFAAYLIVGFVQIAVDAVHFCVVGCEMTAIARNVAVHGSFGNPFNALPDTGPTAANPPIYPLFLAALMRIFRSWQPVINAAVWSNFVANAFTAALLPKVSQSFYGGMWPGILGSILWLVSAPLMPAWDASFTVAGLLLMCVFTTCSLWMRRPLVSGWLAGGLAGVLFLLNPSSLLIFLPWTAYLVVRRKGTWGQMAILLATMTLMISVWAGRNYLRLGAFVVRTNLGMTLYASDNDCAEASLISDEENNCYQDHHPNVSLQEAQLLQTLGEVRFDRRRTADAELWIKTHQGRFWTLTAERFRQFWLPPFYDHPFAIGVIWAVTVLSIPGLVLMFIRREPVTWYVLAVLLLYPIMYYIVVSDVRYRYPVYWLSLLPAGYFIRQSYLFVAAR